MCVIRTIYILISYSVLAKNFIKFLGFKSHFYSYSTLLKRIKPDNIYLMNLHVAIP